MTYASRTAIVSGRASAPEFSRAFPVIRAPKKNVRSVSSGRTSVLAKGSVKTHAEAVERKALEEMFVTSGARFIAVAYAILRNREDAEDAVQNAFCSAHRHLRSFEGRSALRTWLTRIVMNAALMIRRKRKSFMVTELAERNNSRDNWMESVPASQRDPEATHAERETFDFINRILEKMKPALRQAFTMTYFEELSAPEACAMLGVSGGTFKARLFRAKRQVFHQAQRILAAPIRQKTTRSSPDEQVAQYQGASSCETAWCASHRVWRPPLPDHRASISRFRRLR